MVAYLVTSLGRISRARAVCCLICSVVLAAACGGAKTSASLGSSEASDGGEVYHARWTYRSTEVDIDLDLITQAGVEADCFTTARLVVDEFIATRDSYDLAETPCDVLRLTATGDIVLYESATGHDWSTEQLSVDTDAETIELGPWVSEAGISYTLTLAAPECADDDNCICPFLSRSKNSELSVMELGRDCG